MLPQKISRVYPKYIYRWVGDILPLSEAFSPGSLTSLAVQKKLVNKEHAKRFRISIAWWMTQAKIGPQTTISPHGVPIEAWWGETWQKLIYRKVPAEQRRFKYQFLIERAADGVQHHASSLSWLIQPSDITEHNLDAANVETARFIAKRNIARIRQRHMKVEPDGIRGIQSDRREFSVQYSAWNAEVWKSAVGIPGYYGLHETQISGDPPEVKPDT